MIVTCEECSTSFQLDDARIPASGARVRCSRCKHAFFLPNPSASQSQAIHAVVSETLEGETLRAAAPARELASARGAEPDEEDWQFSEEIRVADDEPDEAERGPATSPRADSFDLTGDFGRGFDPETFGSAEPARPAPTAPTAPSAKPTRTDRPKVSASAPSAPTIAPVRPVDSEPKRDESSFGSIDDFSSLIDDDDVSIDLATEPMSETRRGTPKAARPAKTRPAAEDLGDPESWDIVGPGSERKPGGAQPYSSTPAPAPVRKKKPSKGGLDLFAETDLPPIREEQDDGAGLSSFATRLRGTGRLVGGLVAAVCVVFVGATLLRPEWSRWAPTPQRIEAGPLVAETTRMGWVETSRAGFLLVVEGEVRNTGRQPIAPMAVQLSLLDADGTRLSAPPLRVGEPLAAEALRESPPEELERQVEVARASWLATPLAPGEARRFTAVARADGMPPAARRILLEAGAPSGS